MLSGEIVPAENSTHIIYCNGTQSRFAALLASGRVQGYG
jgi:hypothetical protein